MRFFLYTMAVYSYGIFAMCFPLPWSMAVGFLGGLFMSIKEDGIKAWLGIKEENKENGSKV